MYKVQQSKEPSREVGYSLLNPHHITVEKVLIFMLLMRMLRHEEPLAHHTAEI